MRRKKISDKERLDWLEGQERIELYSVIGPEFLLRSHNKHKWFKSLRGIIDAEIRKTKVNK